MRVQISVPELYELLHLPLSAEVVLTDDYEGRQMMPPVLLQPKRWRDGIVDCDPYTCDGEHLKSG